MYPVPALDSTRLPQLVVNPHGIGIIAPECKEFAVIVARKGILCGNQHLSRQGGSCYAGVTAVFPVSFLLDDDQYPAQAIVPYIVIEGSEIGDESVAGVHERKAGFGRNGFGRIKQRKIFSLQRYGHVVVLHDAPHITLLQTVTDACSSVVQHRQRCDNGVGCDAFLYRAQTHLQRDIPADCKPARPNLKAVMFFLQA